MPSPMPNPSGTPITPTLNPAMQNGISPQQALGAKLAAQSNKTAEMMAKIEMRLSEITSVKQTMQNGAYAAFGNNFITRGAMSLGGMIGDMFGSDEEGEETPEKKLAKLMEKQIQVMDLLLVENEIHTKALIDMSDAISQKTLGNSSNRIESIDITELDDDGNPAAFYNMADQLRGRRPVPDDVTDVDFDESPEPFRWTSEQLKKEMPPEPVEKINIDEILNAPWVKNPPKKTGDVEDVTEKIAPLKIGYSPTLIDVLDDIQSPSTPDQSQKSMDDSVPEDNPKPFKSMADSLMGTPSMNPSAIDDDSAQEHDEEVAKERFFKSVVGLLVKIDRGIEKQNSSGPLSTQEADLESIKKDQSSFVDRINEVLSSFQKASTSTILPEVPSSSETPTAIDSPDISVGDIDIDVPDGKTNQRPKKTPSKAQKGLKVLKNAAKLSRMIPGVGLAVGAGMAAYDGIDGWNSANETLGIEGRDATTGEKAASAFGQVAEGLTFGLIDKQTASRWVAPEDKKPSATNSQTMTQAKKNPDIGMAPTSDFDRRGVMFNNDQVAKLDSATDSLRRIENADRRKAPASTPPVMVNNVNNVNNQTLYAPRRNPNNSESSFNRYISSAFQT